MPITVIVRSVTAHEARLTFDGTQRVVIGRGASCDVRLPDASVSLRHACIRAQGADFVVVDEGSTNGTYVGDVRVPGRTSRILRSGDALRLGRVWLEFRIDHSVVTRELAAATRDLALALVSQAMVAMGRDLTTRLRVVEGSDQGTEWPIEDGRTYVVGRGEQCDFALADADVSREHAHLVRREGVVFVRDLGGRNGTWLGEARAPEHRDVVWRPAQMMRMGRTVLALEEPAGDVLAEIECAPDEPLIEPPPDARARALPSASSQEDSPGKPLPGRPSAPTTPIHGLTRQARWGLALSLADLLVMGIAVVILALSIFGLLWLLRG